MPNMSNIIPCDPNFTLSEILKSENATLQAGHLILGEPAKHPGHISSPTITGFAMTKSECGHSSYIRMNPVNYTGQKSQLTP